MKLGFTGTRNGMTPYQKNGVTRLVIGLRPTEFHHGDCVGADADAHNIVRLCMPSCVIGIHPGPRNELSAYCKGDSVCDPMGYFARNRVIVSLTDLLIACPPCEPLPTQGGTLYTINFAARIKKPCIIIYPSGSPQPNGPIMLDNGQTIDLRTLYMNLPHTLDCGTPDAAR